ncbi:MULTISPECIES: BlaI/MecI/CopY family transcriptional regulator [unclassified Rhodococcus (in: high G+C Gram-positive bacteria)]|uniref:BlaI/MecI/CopY family transcriptional regulator n=1 Tax=Rhodococcus sp. SJ-3 TaxID=3454628 RepID=UPI003F7A0360
MTSQKQPDRSSEPVRLGALEQQVMDVLWDRGTSTIRQVIVHLGDHLAYTTIATVMTNLERKRLVLPEKQGRSTVYTPRHTREVHAARLMEQALSTSNDRAASIVHFIDAIDPDDVQRLRDYLAQRGDDR